MTGNDTMTIGHDAGDTVEARERVTAFLHEIQGGSGYSDFTVCFGGLLALQRWATALSGSDREGVAEVLEVFAADLRLNEPKEIDVGASYKAAVRRLARRGVRT